MKDKERVDRRTTREKTKARHESAGLEDAHETDLDLRSYEGRKAAKNTSRQNTSRRMNQKKTNRGRTTVPLGSLPT